VKEAPEEEVVFQSLSIVSHKVPLLCKERFGFPRAAESGTHPVDL
jgi:hypothetical protein